MLIETVSLKQWTQIRSFDICYDSIDDKIKSNWHQIPIPFFKYPSELIFALINTWGLDELGYQVKFHPYCCILQLLQDFESFFVYVIYNILLLL